MPLRDDITFRFMPNRVTLQEASELFPSVKSLPRPRCRLENGKHLLVGIGRCVSGLVPLKKLKRGCVRQSLYCLSWP
jgi:hypothetical protein